MASLDLVSALLIKELGVGCQLRNIVALIVETIAIVWTARNSAGAGRGGRQWGFNLKPSKFHNP